MKLLLVWIIAIVFGVASTGQAYELLVDARIVTGTEGEPDANRVNGGVTILSAPGAGVLIEVELFVPELVRQGVIGFECSFRNDGDRFLNSFILKKIEGVNGIGPISALRPESTMGGVGSLSQNFIPPNGYLGRVVLETRQVIPPETVLEWISASVGLYTNFEQRALGLSRTTITFQGPTFDVSGDLDASSGDQGLQILSGLGAGSTITVEIYGFDIRDAVGFGARLIFDTQKLMYENFEISSIFPNANTPGAIFGTNPTYVEVSGASLGGKAAVDKGLLGKVTFRAKTGFSDTQIELRMVQIRRNGEFETALPGLVLDLVVNASPDFDKDGMVGFRDFLLFAERYGTSRGEAMFSGKFDLDGNGTVGFSDFVVLAGKYGQSV